VHFHIHFRSELARPPPSRSASSGAVFVDPQGTAQVTLLGGHLGHFEVPPEHQSAPPRRPPLRCRLREAPLSPTTGPTLPIELCALLLVILWILFCFYVSFVVLGED
jgi:hypothetical protein